MIGSNKIEFAKANADRKPTEKELQDLNFRAMEWQGLFVSMRKKYGDDVHSYVLSGMDNGYFKELKSALASTCGYEKPTGEKLRVHILYFYIPICKILHNYVNGYF